MAKCKVNFVKKGAMQAAKAPSGAKAAGTEFTITDLGNGKLSVTGHDANGVGGIDMTNTGTLAAVPNDPTILTCDTPVGMTVQVHGVKAGTAIVALTVTSNDGSYGPLSIDVTATVSGRTPAGLDVVFTAADQT